MHRLLDGRKAAQAMPDFVSALWCPLKGRAAQCSRERGIAGGVMIFAMAGEGTIPAEPSGADELDPAIGRGRDIEPVKIN